MINVPCCLFSFQQDKVASESKLNLAKPKNKRLIGKDKEKPESEG